MKRAKRLCVPVLLGVLLMTTLVGAASARPNARPQQQAWRVLAVHPDACVPVTDDMDYARANNDLHSNVAVGAEPFRCAFDFPAAGEQAVGAVNVKRVTMYAYDNTNKTAAGFELRKLYPPSKGMVVMASGTSTDSSADPQAVVDTSIVNNPIYRVQAPSIHVYMGITINLYGFLIHYTW